MPDRPRPTSDDEREVLDHLAAAWDRFIALPDPHPDDVAEFRHFIHGCQYLIAWRVARRVDPGTWGSPPVAPLAGKPRIEIPTD